MRVIPSLSVIAMAALLVGCALAPLKPGMSRDEVISRRGSPSAIVPLAGGGSRLQYSGQPAGQFADMVDVDAAGKVVAVRQVLAPAEFARIELGKWTRQDVEREFGRPAKIDRVYSWPEDIMTYRWRDANSMDMLFWVYLDSRNVVQRVGQGMEIRTRLLEPGY